MRLAKQVESAAKASAPVKTGTYAASIRAETVDHPTRVIGRVVADVDYALVVEANTGNLARALDAAG
jgi:bisphosphoglycerate-independent phosphoglycerate mutase (AlkP superfamily)